MQPVEQLHVRIAPHLAKDGGAFDTLVTDLIEFAE
jgi:hypothetical protein